MKLNTPVKAPPAYNHEGTRAVHSTPLRELRRAVLACLLWEDSFYESGVSTADRIKSLVAKCVPVDVMALAIKARHEMKLRHVPLLLAREMARLPEHKTLVAHTLEAIIERPDEITEFLAIYWKDGKQPLSAQVKKGLARAFEKFNEYSLAKYDREGKVRLRDALFLSHAKPGDRTAAALKGRPTIGVGEKATTVYTKAERALNMRRVLSPREDLYRRLIAGELTTPDTWEVALSGGADKRETFERLLADNKLGALALLRNLRNMRDAGVDRKAVAGALDNVKVDRVLPFRFIAAARACPGWEDLIEPAMLRCLEGRDRLPGKTVLLIDTSPSMRQSQVSAKSELTREDAALGLAILAREVCEEIDIYAFSNEHALVPARRGFALADAIQRAVPSNGTRIGSAVLGVSGRYQRLIVMTDEESQDAVGAPDAGKIAYMINVATYKNGVGFGAWNRIDGWSEAVFDYIRELEAEEVAP